MFLGVPVNKAMPLKLSNILGCP